MKTSRSLATRGARIAVGGALALSGLAVLGQGPAAVADTAPPPGLPATVSAAPLPAPQIGGGTGGAAGAQGGVVWATEVVGDIAFAGGNFTQATDPGTTEPKSRGNLLAFDVTTGLLTDFAPDLNGQVLALDVSPDGSVLYVGGAFTTATVPDGDDAGSDPDVVQRRRLAAFDVATGELVDTFAPPVNADVAAVVATDDVIYAGGSFQGIGATDRQYLAAFDLDGTVRSWAPEAKRGPVTSLAVNPDATKIAVGGYFTALTAAGGTMPAGVTSGYGLGMVNAAGEPLQMEVNRVVRNGRPTERDPGDELDGAITALSTDGTNIYGTGFTYQSKEGGTLEGVFAASWDGGKITWINDCHGDAYDVQAIGDVVYAAGHTHYCENNGGVRQGPGGVPDYPYYRAIASTTDAADAPISWEPDQNRYQNYEGLPAPTMLGWYPSFNAGTFTGQAQGPWTVSGNDDFVVMGGEFTRVDSASHVGLVRFGVSTVTVNATTPSPNTEGPQYFAGGYPIKVTSTERGAVRINWGTNRDDDNETLTYRVRRRTYDPMTGVSGSSSLMHTRTAFARFWNPYTMGYTDTSAVPGQTYQYRVDVSDPFTAGGAAPASPWTAVTVATSGADSAYVKAVYDDEPTHWWRLGSIPDDAVAFQGLTAGSGVATGVAGALPGDTAYAFDGTEAGSAAAGDHAANCSRDSSYDKITVCWPPDVFSLETWFKTTTTQGGRLVGWSNRATGGSTKADRHLYMDDAGRIRFGVKPDDRRIAIASRAGLNDGQWHHAVGTLSAEGMKLYIDGDRVAARTDVTVGEHLSLGTWRLGGDTLQGWPGAPTSGYFAGSLDEAAVYKAELTAERVAAHAQAGGRTPSGVPVAAFEMSATQATKTISVNGSGSSDPGGSITKHEWDFGDGTTATGPTASHTYAAPGRYDVTLTVTDNQGLTDSVTRMARIEGPPTATWNVSRVLNHDVRVDAGLAADPDGGAILTYTWDWGDGSARSGANPRPTHTYAADGTYMVTLTTTDDEGQQTTSAPLQVTVPNTAPVAAGTVAVDGMTVRTDASGSSDPDGTIASYSWTFGSAFGSPTIQGATAEYTFATPGTYRVRLTVVDDDGASTRLDQQVTVPGATTPPPTPPPTTTPPTTTPTTPGTVTPPPPTTSTSKATATLQGKAVTKRVRGKVAVKVVWKVARTGGGNATGKVTVKVGKKKFTGTLRNGKVTIKLGKYAARGKLKVKAQYGGDATTAGASKVLKVKLR